MCDISEPYLHMFCMKNPVLRIFKILFSSEIMEVPKFTNEFSQLYNRQVLCRKFLGMSESKVQQNFYILALLQLVNKEYLVIIFLISHPNHMLCPLV